MPSIICIKELVNKNVQDRQELKFSDDYFYY